MALITLKETLTDARDRQYVIPCLEAINLEAIIDIVKAAHKKNSTLMLCYNKQLTPQIPIEVTMRIIVNIAKKKVSYYLLD